MSDSTLVYLRDLAKLGARRVTFAPQNWPLPLEVEFFPPIEPIDTHSPHIPRAMELALPQPGERCPCGHDDMNHDWNGLCLQGCDVATCTRHPSDAPGTP